MTNIIATLIILLLVGGAVTYIVRAKRRGVKCVGCPDAGQCSAHREDRTAGCGCGCHEK